MSNSFQSILGKQALIVSCPVVGKGEERRTRRSKKMESKQVNVKAMKANATSTMMGKSRERTCAGPGY
jgi:hypothetical protein